MHLWELRENRWHIRAKDIAGDPIALRDYWAKLMPEHEYRLSMTKPRKNEDYGRVVQEASTFLQALLADGPLPTMRVLDQGQAHGHNSSALRRAARTLGVVSRKAGMAAGWEWALPEHAPTPVETITVLYRSGNKRRSITLPDWATDERAAVREWLELYD